MSDFKIEKVLGRGSFGSVYLVTRKQDQKIYALKTVILEKLSKKEQENSVNEVRILASITHPNVIGYKEAFWNDKESSLNIVMEYADDGDLQTKIHKMKKEGGMFNENLIWSYSIQMIEGLKALHDKKIMHRDLKSANIFLVKDKHQCKLGDMNVSKVIKDKVLLTQTGTPYYASPEVWNDEPYSYKSDLWSIGCVIYEICALHPPFHGKDLDELYANVCKGKIERISQVYSEDLWKMIKMLIQVDVNKRVDCDRFLNSKLIIKKKKELKEKNKEFNYLENNLEKNNNNGILLNTIKFSNIREIKSQLPKNKNYNNENEDYTNYNGYENILQKYQNLNDKFKKYKKVNHNSNNLNNNIIKNYPSNICIDNNNNYKIKSNRNIRKINSEKLPENITYSINRTNSGTTNDTNTNTNTNKNPKHENKNVIKLQSNIMQSIKTNNSKNKLHKANSKRQFTLNEYPSLRNVRQLNQKSSKERFKTEQQKEKEKAVYIKIKHKNKSNLINSIPNSIKRTITTRQNVPKIQKENHLRFTSGNYSYLKLEDVKAVNIYNQISKINSISEIRSKTPSLYDKNIYKIPKEILTNNIYNNYNNNSRKQNLEHKKSMAYLRNNLKTSNSIKEENVLYKYTNNKNMNHISTKSNCHLNQNLNNFVKKEMIKKIIQNKKNNLNNRERPSSAALSKRIFDNNNLNNNKNLSLNHNYEFNNFSKKHFIPKSQIIHTSNSICNINNNSKNYKSFRLTNKSTGNINCRSDIISDNYSPIRKRNTYTNNKYKKNYEQIQTMVDSEKNMNYNYSNINQNKLKINNNPDMNIINNNKYNPEKNIKKINNSINIPQKRVFNEKNKERNRNNLIPHRDLTESDLMIILNDIKGKENHRNNKKKCLNLSLNDNIAPNNFLKHIRKAQYLNTNNIKLNQFYSNKNNNIKSYERNKGTHIYNNFYSINNIGGSNVPVKVINVYN